MQLILNISVCVYKYVLLCLLSCDHLLSSISSYIVVSKLKFFPCVYSSCTLTMASCYFSAGTCTGGHDPVRSMRKELCGRSRLAVCAYACVMCIICVYV